MTIETVRLLLTWLPPIGLVALWAHTVHREQREYDASITVRVWYSNVWFVLACILVWALFVDWLFLRLKR